MLDITM